MPGGIQQAVQLLRYAPSPAERLSSAGADLIHDRIAQTLCILLAEDEPMILEIMSESLRDAGYEVMEAADGSKAMAFLAKRATPFSGLVTDFNMPGFDGAQVASRARHDFPSIPVIIATGRADSTQRAWRDDLGYVLLRKPYAPSELVSILKALVAPPHA